MVVSAVLLWLSIGWLTEAALTPRGSSVCDSGGPCVCSVGKLTCDCSTSFLKEVVLRTGQLDMSIGSISITNCFHLHVTSNCFAGLTALQRVSVANVKQITLEERAFNWTTGDKHHTGLVINITNCNIRQVPSYSFGGKLRDIFLSSTNISRISTYAFGSLDAVDKIEMNGVNVIETESQCFKRISVEFLTVSDSNFSVLTERTMSDMTVNQEVRFVNVKIGRLERHSLRINSPRNFRLIKSEFGHVESHALEIRTKGDVSIHDNTFSHLESHAFMGVSVESKYLREAGKQDLVFENNTLIEFENESLKLNGSAFDLRLDWIMLKQKCSCDSANSWVNNVVVLSNSNSRQVMPSLDKIIYCLDSKPISVGEYLRGSCNVFKLSVWTVAVVVAAVVATLSLIALVVYCGVRNRGKKYINVPTTRVQATGNSTAHMLVVPDGRTYQETEFHVILEHAEPIRTTNIRDRPDTG